MPTTQPGLLEAQNVRIDEHGVPSVDGLSLVSQGSKIVVLGAPRALFEGACGMIQPTHGELLLRGAPAHLALESGGVAGAPLDPPLPPKWTPRRYVEWSARLAGHSRAEARVHATSAIASLELTTLADFRLQVSPLAVRRATVIAAAIATRAPILVLEDPSPGLPEAAYRSLTHIVARALRPYPWVLFAARAPIDTPLCLEADEAILLSGGRLGLPGEPDTGPGSRVLAQGLPAELAARERTYAVRIAGDAPTFASLAMARGARVEACGSELTLELGETLRTRDLLELASEARSVIMELRPLSRAFA